MKISFSRAVPLLFIYLLGLFNNFLTYVYISGYYIYKFPPPSSDTDFYRFIVFFMEENSPIVSKEVFYYSPLFSYIIYIFKILFQNNFLDYIVLFNIFIGATIPVAVFLILRLYRFSTTLSIFFSVATTFFDMLLIYSSFPLKTTLGIALIVWGLLFFFKYSLEKRAGLYLFLSGLFLGLASLVYVNLLMFVVFLTIYLIITCWRKSIFFVLPVILIVSITAVRNYTVSQDFVPVTSIGGIHFYIGNNKYANGMYTKIPGIRSSGFGHYFDGRKIAEESLKRKLKPSEVSDFWFQKGLNEILEHPAFFTQLFLKKMFLTINYFDIPNNINKNILKQNSSFLSLLSIGFGFFAVLGLSGFVLALRDRKFLIIHIFFLVYTASVVLFFITDRYRLPLFIPFIVYGAYFLNFILREELSGFKKAVVFFMFVFTATIVYLPNPIEKLQPQFKRSFLVKESISNKLYQIEKEIQQTKEPIRKSELYLKMAVIYLKTQSTEQATYLLMRSLKYNPENKSARFYLKALKTGKKVIFPFSN